MSWSRIERWFFRRLWPAAVAALLTGCLVGEPAKAERRAPEAYGVFQGDTMFTVLPSDAIPAILKPEFVSGREAEEQMLPEEPVLGVALGEEVRAYSLWQLDAHEIVNDAVGGMAIAVTW